MINPPILQSRAALTWVASMIFASALGVFLLWHADRNAAKLAPGLYLIAINGPASVQIGFRTKSVSTALTVPLGRKIAIEEGENLLALYPDGHQQSLSGPMRLTLSKKKPDEITPLNASLVQLLNTPFTQNPPTSSVEISLVHVTSPSGVTRFLNPTITWETRGDLRYDLGLIDLADPQAPPRVLRAMRPPVALASLETTEVRHLVPDRIYGVVVRETNDTKILGTGRFLTTADATIGELPTQPAALLTEAFVALAIEPARAGDAWLALSRLPPDWKQSELAIRLRLKVAQDLELPDAFAAAKADARALAHR